MKRTKRFELRSMARPTEPAAPVTEKLCPACHTTKPAEEFAKHSGRASLHKHCRACEALQQSERRVRKSGDENFYGI